MAGSVAGGWCLARWLLAGTATRGPIGGSVALILNIILTLILILNHSLNLVLILNLNLVLNLILILSWGNPGTLEEIWQGTLTGGTSGENLGHFGKVL